jgi:hypothetical protein
MRFRLKLNNDFTENGGADVNRKWRWYEPCPCGCDYREDKSLYGYFGGGFGKFITKLTGKCGFSFQVYTKDNRRYDSWLDSDNHKQWTEETLSNFQKENN